MRKTSAKFKKTIRCRVLATNGEVKIRFPKQMIGTVAIVFENETKSLILRQYELYLKGDNLETARIA